MLKKKRILTNTVWVMLLMTMFASVSYAKTQYVTDVLYITLRAGPADTFKVIKALKTGTKLNVLDEKEGYSFVHTMSGDEGWASSKYLVDEPVAVLKLGKLQVTMDELIKDYNELKKSNAVYRKKIKELEKDRKRLTSNGTKLEKENVKMKALSANPMAISKQNAELKAANEASESQIAQLEEENSTYKGNTRRDWFLVGGGVLVFGVILGLVLPSIRLRRNKAWT